MSDDISDEQEFYDKLRGKKQGIEQGTLIWMLAFVLSILTFLIGLIDWLADYTFLSANSSEYFAGRNEAGNFVETYTSSNGETSVRTLQPIFEWIVTRNQEGGFLPDYIGLYVHDWIVLSVIILLAIPSFFIYQREGRRLEAIDKNLPYLLREIADSQRIGMQLPRAISEAAKRNYGPLTPELKKLASKVSWGIPFRDAMMAFRNAVNTPLARQATILILEAERSGGELEKIFDSAKDYVEELLAIKEERESSIKPYIYIIFVSYAIFAVVIFVLFTTFFAPFGATEVTDQNTGESYLPVPVHVFKGAFLYMLVIQGLFSGLTAGKMGRGSIKLGLLYSSALMFVGFIVHKFLIVPQVDQIIQDAQG